MVNLYGTLGPACGSEKVLAEMFSLGMTGMRLNLSHVTLAESGELIGKMNRAAEKCGVKPQLLVDLQGPELRTGTVAEPVALRNGDIVEICEISENVKAGRSTKIMLPELTLPYLVPGQEVLLDDGKIHLKIVENPVSMPENRGEEIEKKRCFAKVLWGGLLKSRKSVALPGAKIYPPTLTKADLENIKIAKEMGVTGVMQPFVRDHRDLECVKKTLREAGAEDIRLFAKIENMDGVRKLEELFPAADEIVIARGDLGNAMPLAKLPCAQEEIAAQCRKHGRAFMVVTQMLASMEHRAVPTRAEVSDIFRAVQQGAASVMLTGETAAGEYPLEAMEVLVDTVREAEWYLEERR